MANGYRNVEPNKLIHLANLMRSGQDKLNYLRGAGVGPLGDLFLGPATDVVEGLSYGELPITGSGQTTQLDPGVFDLAAMGTVPVAAGKNILQKLMASKLRDKPVDQSRRDFLKAGAVVTGLGAVASKSPTIAKSLVKDTAEAAVPAAARGLAAYTPAFKSNLLRDTMMTLIGKFKDASGKAVPKAERMKMIDDLIATAPKEEIQRFHKYTDDMVAKHGDDFDPKGFRDRLWASPTDDWLEASPQYKRLPDDYKPTKKDVDSYQIQEVNGKKYQYTGKGGPGTKEYDDFQKLQSKTMEWFNELPEKVQDDIMEQYKVTGKMPDKYKDKMKTFDFDLYNEYGMDSQRGTYSHEIGVYDHIWNNLVKQGHGY